MLPYTAIGAYSAASRMMQSAPRPMDQAARSRTEDLEIKLERSNLIVQTLLMILLEKQIVHEDEFREWMKYVDELDGARDGRVRAENTPLSCPSCGRNSPHMAPKCIYCGHEFPVEFLARRPPDPEAPPNP